VNHLDIKHWVILRPLLVLADKEVLLHCMNAVMDELIWTDCLWVGFIGELTSYWQDCGFLW